MKFQFAYLKISRKSDLDGEQVCIIVNKLLINIG